MISISLRDAHEMKFPLVSFNIPNDLDFEIYFSKQTTNTAKQTSLRRSVFILMALVAHFSADLDTKTELVPAT